MEIEKSKVLIQFLLNFRQSGDVLFFLNVRRLRGYTATVTESLAYMEGTEKKPTWNKNSRKKLEKYSSSGKLLLQEVIVAG